MANGVTTSLGTWDSHNSFIERIMDDGALAAAHPDETLIAAGPPSFYIGETDPETLLSKLLPLGMLLNFQINTGVPSQPVQTLGTARSFGARGKAQVSWSAARMEIEGRSFLRALSTNVVQSGVDSTKFDDMPSSDQIESQWTNLDSEVFYIPFGLYVFVANKARRLITASLLERAMITSESQGFQAGGMMIASNIAGWCDRKLPLPLGSNALPTKAGRASLDTIRSNVLGIPAGQATPDLSSR